MKYSRRNNIVYNIVFSTFVLFLATESSLASEPAIGFDVPAMLPVHELIPAGIPPVTQSKIIEVVIPVTAEIRPSDRDHIAEFRFDVSWIGQPFPVADYGPKSQTVSHIEGTIKVDQSDDSKIGLGIDGQSEKLEVVTVTGNLDLSKGSTARKTYQEIPQHYPVIASGTINRGTGAFFRFHRSRTETLEGGREVVVAFRVGRDWQGGILKVDCRALGQRKIFGAIPDDIDVGKAFVVPVYIEGDVEANGLAQDFIAAEQSLRRHWHHRRKARSMSSGEALLAGFNPFVQSFSKQHAIPDQWVHRLIQSGEDQVFENVKHQLPQSTSMLAERFVSARKRLTEASH